jgi:hypothetical protein
MQLTQEDVSNYRKYICGLESFALSHGLDLAPEKYPGATKVFEHINTILNDIK